MKVFIAGASGILGRDLAKLLSRNSIDYLGSYNSRPTEKCIKFDFFNEDEVERNLLESKVDVVINCIVERFTDVCEKDWNKTISVNVVIPDILSRVCARNNISFIHISTDYVFDGKSPPYSPLSEPNPLQNYGISKLIAEYRIKANLKQYLIIRVPVLYTDSYEYLDETAVTTLGKKVMNQIDTFTEDNVSIRRPVYIPDFCEFLVTSILTNKTGIHHYYNSVDKTTKYKMIKEISKYMNLRSNHILPINSFADGGANRPLDTELADNSVPPLTVSITKGIELCFERFIHPDFSECPEEFLVIFDLDGTLIDSDTDHYYAYRLALSGWTDLSKEYYFNIINTKSIDYMLEDLKIPVDIRPIIKRNKQNIMNTSVDWIYGAEKFIMFLDSLGIEMAIVTNTDKANVEKFCNHLPTLRKIKNVITRQDYLVAKPDPECYKLAVERYGKGKKYIVGFENTVNGLRALKGVTNRTYCIANKYNYLYNDLKKEDTILIHNFDFFAHQ